MATLATVALKCAVQLGRVNAAGTAITDLETEIKDEIGETIKFYNRRPWHVTEVRDIEISTVASTQWYSTADLTSGAGDQDLTGRSAVDINTIFSIDYIHESTSAVATGLTYMNYRDFQTLNEGTAPGGYPIAYTLYGGQIGFYPAPDAIYTIKFSAHVKPVVPTDDADTSVWFDEAEEMIVAGAIKRVCLKHTRDTERATEQNAIEQAARNEFHSEYVRKASTGRIKPH